MILGWGKRQFVSKDQGGQKDRPTEFDRRNATSRLSSGL